MHAAYNMVQLSCGTKVPPTPSWWPAGSTQARTVHGCDRGQILDPRAPYEHRQHHCALGSARKRIRRHFRLSEGLCGCLISC
ncbi:hypothetical protein PAPYR_7277 [Paratrimastix pyriformis]|uniref:Uncharacterized protein n=1 Tax=Paratrimastix pyriformis TaxID=342808 RepID=A0ABQ8UDB4_9EUKA|nr:hypothetical protein PAPYR_7277 [Paratrimastix pyriformis]